MNAMRTFPSKQLLIVLAIICLLLALADVFYEKHPHVHFESWFNFFGFFAALATIVLLGIAAVTHNVLQREEDYYDE